MGRAAGGGHHGGGHGGIVPGQEIMAAHAGPGAVQQIARQIIEPVLVRPAIGVGEGDDFARGGGDAGVARRGKAQMFLADARGVFVLRNDLRGGVGRAVVHHQDFVIGVVQTGQRIQARLEGAGAIVAGHDDGNPGDAREREKGSGLELLLHHGKGGLGPAVAGGQAEIPIGHIAAIPVPLVGEAIDDDAGQAGSKSQLDLPGEHFTFFGLAFTQAVQAGFPQEQRLGAGQRLQAGQVVFKRPRLMEEDVEADEIYAGRMQEFGGRIIGERAKAIRVRVFGRVNQLIQEHMLFPLDIFQIYTPDHI